MNIMFSRFKRARVRYIKEIFLIHHILTLGSSANVLKFSARLELGPLLRLLNVLKAEVCYPINYLSS